MRYDIPVDPDAETAREWAREELAKSEYTNGGESWIDRVMNWFQDLIESLFGGVGEAFGGWGVVLTVVIIAAVIGVIIWLVVGPLRRSRSTATDDDLGDLSLSADDYAAQASTAMAAENWNAAVIAWFRALVRGLDEREIIALKPGMTADEAASLAAGALPSAAAPMDAAAEVFDAVRYGYRAATKADAEKVRAARDAAAKASRDVETDDAPASESVTV